MTVTRFSRPVAGLKTRAPGPHGATQMSVFVVLGAEPAPHPPTTPSQSDLRVCVQKLDLTNSF